MIEGRGVVIKNNYAKKIIICQNPFLIKVHTKQNYRSGEEEKRRCIIVDDTFKIITCKKQLIFVTLFVCIHERMQNKIENLYFICPFVSFLIWNYYIIKNTLYISRLNSKLSGLKLETSPKQ